MIQPLLNWRTALSIVAIAIVGVTVIYSRVLAKKIALEERERVAQWVEAGKLLVEDSTGVSDRLVSTIIAANKTIPIIQTDEQDRIIEHVNLDPQKVAQDPGYLDQKLRTFRSDNPPIVWKDPRDSTRYNYYYYGNTELLDQVRYYPLVQLLVVGLFIIITITALTTSFRSTQNQVWAGMAKETAHQLGTPLTSLQGWVEMLRETGTSEKMVAEISKDVERLRLVSDRFGKIGSIPHLEPHNIILLVEQMMEYMRRRATDRVRFEFHPGDAAAIMVPVSAPLFDWVIENLLKNALDAMEGKGVITVTISNSPRQVYIDVSDTGKGISRKHLSRVFQPGFTTKKRGWGLGLSLSRRIIEQYHKGQLFVKSSEPGKGTTFRIILHK